MRNAVGLMRAEVHRSILTEIVMCDRGAAQSQDARERPGLRPPSLPDGRRPALATLGGVWLAGG